MEKRGGGRAGGTGTIGPSPEMNRETGVMEEAEPRGGKATDVKTLHRSRQAL